MRHASTKSIRIRSRLTAGLTAASVALAAIGAAVTANASTVQVPTAAAGAAGGGGSTSPATSIGVPVGGSALTGAVLSPGSAAASPGDDQPQTAFVLTPVIGALETTVAAAPGLAVGTGISALGLLTSYTAVFTDVPGGEVFNQAVFTLIGQLSVLSTTAVPEVQAVLGQALAQLDAVAAQLAPLLAPGAAPTLQVAVALGGGLVAAAAAIEGTGLAGNVVGSATYVARLLVGLAELTGARTVVEETSPAP